MMKAWTYLEAIKTDNMALWLEKHHMQRMTNMAVVRKIFITTLWYCPHSKHSNDSKSNLFLNLPPSISHSKK